jgi:hypothetical protein
MLKEKLGVDCELAKGPSGSFLVAVGADVVAQRGRIGFPSDQEIVDAVAAKLARTA